MRQMLDHCGSAGEGAALRAMFEARKQVFVDLLRWEVPVLDGRYEVDQFDTPAASYIIQVDDRGRHRASTRLLPTLRPHILDSLFPHLCEGEVPRGETVFEITRFCLDRRQTAIQRRAARNHLVSAIVDAAEERGITTLTGVADISWFQQIIGFGWRCRALGLPKPHAGEPLVALRIDLDANTIAAMTAAGIYDGAGQNRSAIMVEAA